MKTLLYLQNNTFESLQTFEYIVELARYIGADLKIIHIQFPDNVFGNVLDSDLLFQSSEAYNQARDEFMNSTTRNIKILLEAGKIEKDIPVDFFSGIPTSVLSYLHETGYFDMLVLENENQKVNIYPYQSIKEIIRNIKCPIWVVPTNEEFIPMKQLAYMTDYQQEDINAVRFLADFFHREQLTVKLIHFSDRNDFQEDIKQIGFEVLLSDKLESIHIQSCRCSFTNQASLPQKTEACITKENPDLIIALKDNKNFIQRIVYKSFIHSTLSAVRKPYLILHRENFYQYPPF